VEEANMGLALGFIFGGGITGVLTHVYETRRISQAEQYDQHQQIYRSISEAFYGSDRAVIDLYSLWASGEGAFHEPRREEAIALIDSLVTYGLKLQMLMPTLRLYFDSSAVALAAQTSAKLDALLSVSFSRLMPYMDTAKVDALFGSLGDSGLTPTDFRAKHDEFASSLNRLLYEMGKRAYP
jgi:hypothetical protein